MAPSFIELTDVHNTVIYVNPMYITSFTEYYEDKRLIEINVLDKTQYVKESKKEILKRINDSNLYTQVFK